MIDKEQAKKQVEAIRRNVAGPPSERDDNITDADRSLLIEFDEQLVRDRKSSNRCGWYHHYSALSDAYQFTQVAPDALHRSIHLTTDDEDDGDDGENGEDEDEDRAKNALERITTWIHSQGFSDYTVQGKLSSLRVIAGTVLGGEDQLPEHYQNIEPADHVDEDPAPLPGNILEYADLLRMLKATNCPRDRALLATQWATGMRPRTLWLLTHEQIEFHDDHVKITLPERGKSDKRQIIVVTGSQLLTKWIKEEHPVHDDPEDSLGPDTWIWSYQDKNEHLGYEGLATRFYKAGERAGIEKDHSPQHFRRSAASILASEPTIGERDLRYRFAWSPKSNAPEHYIAAHSTSVNENVAEARGAEFEDLTPRPDTAPVVCPSCGEWTTRGLDECIWCPQNLDTDQATFDTSQTMQNPTKAGTQSVADLILSGEVTADDLRTLRRLEPQLKAEPTVFDDLDELIQKADALADAHPDDDSTSAYAATPAGVAGWLSATVSRAASGWARAKHAALSLHPDLPKYPPRGSTRTKLAAGIGVYLLGFAVFLEAVGLLDALAAGEPTAVGALMLGLPLGVWHVDRTSPSVEEALEALREENSSA